MSNQEIINNESTQSTSQRNLFFEYFYVFVLIIYAGQANSFVETLSFIRNPIGTFFLLMVGGIIALRWKVVINKQFYLLIFFYFLYFLAISIKYKIFHPTIFLDYFLLFFIVYVTIRSLKHNLFRIYEEIIYWLAIIGLFFWVVQIGLRGDNLFQLFSKIPNIDAFSYVTAKGLNAIIYTVQPASASILYSYNIPRNCGFAWEPGGFAVYLCIAIFINIFIVDRDHKSRVRLWVMIAALITSQSTTGYMIFMIIVLYYYMNKRMSLILLMLPIVIMAGIFVFSLPFMNKKIVDLISETDDINNMVEQSIGREIPINPQRFSSFLIATKDFYDNPILGLGGNPEERWTYKISANISPISGVGNLLTNFGLVGFLFFIISSVRTSFYFSEYYRYKGKMLVFLIILFISVSYSIILFPIVMCFWMFQLFKPMFENREGQQKPALLQETESDSDMFN